MKPPRKTAFPIVNVYERYGKIVVVPTSQTLAGFYVDKDPAKLLKADWNEIGEAVLAARKRFEAGVPVPVWTKKSTHPAREAFGARSEAEFLNYCRLCSVEFTPEKIHAIPYQNRGADEGFVPAEAVACEAFGPDAAAVGDAVRRALSLSGKGKAS